jgi:hypothetical protein
MPTVPIQVPVRSGFPSGLRGIVLEAGRAPVPPSSPDVTAPLPRPPWPDAGTVAEHNDDDRDRTQAGTGAKVFSHLDSERADRNTLCTARPPNVHSPHELE